MMNNHNTWQKISIILTMFAFLHLTPTAFDHIIMNVDEDVYIIVLCWLISGVNLIIRTMYLPKVDKHECKKK